MPENQQDGSGWKHIQVRQQNVNKSLISQLDLLVSLRHNIYDICMIQKPYIDLSGKSQANWQWITVYPNTHKDHLQATRAAILINTNICTDTWKQIQFQHPDITAIELTGEFSTLHIINIYNNCNNNGTLTHLSTYMQDCEWQRYTTGPLHTLWQGDLNRHHPLWDKAQNAHLFTKENLELMQPLLNMLGRHNMKMALLAYTPTLWAHNTGNHTRVDNVFCSMNLLNVIVKCDTDNELCPVKMDHYPIITWIDICTPRTKIAPKHNFRQVNWMELVKTLKENLTNLPLPTEIPSIQNFDKKLKMLNEAIQDAINKNVELSKPSPYSKWWWSPGLSEEKKQMQWLAGRAKHHHMNPNHPIHNEHH